MEVTGVSFDIHSRTLTLQNIFAMELYRYGSALEDIISEATQETKIENELLKIETYWRHTVLSIVKYKKDGVERGLVLRPSDDLKQQLEDNMV
jgi:dynein heavy chain